MSRRGSDAPVQVRALLILAAALLLAACGSATVAPPQPISLTIAASSSAKPVIQALSDNFSAANPQISFEIIVANSTRSLEHLAAGEADIAIVSHLPPDAKGFRQTPLARDALLLIVHPDNPVDNLTPAELATLYSGRIYKWRKAEGFSEGVQVVVRERTSGLRAVFNEAVMDGERITPNARVFPNGKAVARYVSQERGAIGYISAADLSDAVKIITLNGVSPSPENLQNQAYPLACTLYAVTAPEASAELKDFMNYLRSSAGQAVVQAQGMVSAAER